MAHYEFTIKIPYEQLDGVLCSAFEGGSNYWADKIKTIIKPRDEEGNEGYGHQVPIYGGTLQVYVGEDDKWFDFGPAELQRGVEIMAEKYPRHFADMISGEDDADTGDVLLQCSLFGDVIFG